MDTISQDNERLFIAAATIARVSMDAVMKGPPPGLPTNRFEDSPELVDGIKSGTCISLLMMAHTFSFVTGKDINEVKEAFGLDGVPSGALEQFIEHILSSTRQ